ncbi:serine hydrolase domain-containing protein [Paenibacillus sp. NPDC056722]|uniref:serine hydrolase domain-containing protein n=1 Tax=Paenibacillus sp. NPDC056722 TaxID=3345924 RepID=UPI003684CBF5
MYHCLTNTAGIPNYTSSPDFWPRTMRLPSTLDQLIDSFKEQKLEFQPGSRFGYSSSGYAILTGIIENVSGMSYSDYIQAQICLPLGMYNTGCDDGINVIPGMASGYSFWEKPIHTAYADMSLPLGSYGLYSTTEDLLVWDQALKSAKILSQELMNHMFTPHLQSYACGWVVSNELGRKCLNHFGDISGFFNDFLRFVDDELTIIFLNNMNVTPVTHLSRDIAKTIFEDQVTLPPIAVRVPLTGLDALTGCYFLENETNTHLDISTKNQELYLTVTIMYGVPYKFKLIPIRQEPGRITFITDMIYEHLEFCCSLSGKVEYLLYTDYHGELQRGYTMSG